MSNIVRSKEEIRKGFGSLLELQKKLFQEYLDAEGLGLYDEVPVIKSVAAVQREDPKPMDEETDFLGPDPFDISRKHYLELDHEVIGFLATLR